MKQNSQESVTTQDCPEHVARELKLAGGTNRFGEPNFRVVWGWNRIVPMTGEWQEFEHLQATLTDKLTGHQESRTFIRLKESKIETRQVPKYLPANCWHLEKWCSPEEVGVSPEMWRQLGQEVIAGLTIDTAGEFPSRGEYELCYPITHDCSCSGKPLPLIADVVAEIVQKIQKGRDFSLQQRKTAIEQRLEREQEGFTRKAIDIMKDGMRPFCAEDFVTVPDLRTVAALDPTAKKITSR